MEIPVLETWHIVLIVIGSILLLLWFYSLLQQYFSFYSLRGKTVVITGGSSGIGKAIAKQCLERGANVALLARTEKTLLGFLLRLHPFYVHRIEAKAELEAHAVKFNAKVAGNSGKVTIHIGDVSDDTSAQKALQGAAVAHGGIIDCIVTSAGISKPCRFEDMSATEFASVLTTNVTGTRNAIYHALPFMTRSTGGRIMLISSQAGQVGLYGYTAYSASKFALSGFAQSLSMEVYTRKIYVSVCFPPDTDTPLLAEENKTKPLVTKLLSAATETVSADVVAKSTVKSMEYFAPLVGIQFDGWMLATLTSGMTLQPNFFMALIELLTLGLWRMVGMIYMTYFFFVIGRNDIVKAGSTKGNPAGSKSNSVINNERKNN